MAQKKSATPMRCVSTMDRARCGVCKGAMESNLAVKYGSFGFPKKAGKYAFSSYRCGRLIEQHDMPGLVFIYKGAVKFTFEVASLNSVSAPHHYRV